MKRARVSAAHVIAFAVVCGARPGTAAPVSAQEQADRYYAEGNVAEAVGYYAAAARSDPRNAVALRQAGACHVRLGEMGARDAAMPEYRAAESQLRASLALVESDGRTHMWLARCLGQEALYVGVWKSVPIGRELKQHVDRAIVLDPTLDTAYHIRARWHREVTEKPKIARVPLGLGDADLKKGFADIRKAIELNPQHIKHRAEIARFYLRMKQPDAARTELESALAMTTPDDPENKSEAEQLLASLTAHR